MLRNVSDAAKTTVALESPGTQNSSDVVNYVQYGIVTRRISAVIEIGEDGHFNSTAASECQPIPRSPLPVAKQDEVIIMKHIASDTSDMTVETSQETCAESVASITQELVSIESGGEDDASFHHQPIKESTEEATPAENAGEHGKGYVSAAYSLSSIDQVKAEVANVLIKLSCSSESYESAVSAQKKNRVQFVKAIVTEVRERPRIDPDDVSALFYTISDIERFEDEADESSCDGSCFSTGNSFSYTVTPTPSYLEGTETDENETSVAIEPTTKGSKTIGPGAVDGLVAEAYEALVDHLSNMTTSTNNKRAIPGSENYGLPNNGTMPIAEV